VIDWQRVRDYGVKNAYIRATIGSAGVDHLYERNRANASINVSYYALFKGHQDGIRQADHFINTIQQWNLNLPPAIDVEPVADDIATPLERTEQLKRMVDRIRDRTGQMPVIYTGAVWNALITSQYDPFFAQCKLWVAMYNPLISEPTPLPRGWGKWWLWQYTSSGSVPGISTKVDLNRFNPNW
jgi:lysozyme